ncbi:hypothetical protein ABEB36_002089 [Hypothenemus hampei]|uniref:GTP-binding protein 10 n=1 Tax=Hypothenemus hampei TaxID=57062 RepID=A0ABD1F4I3_HYPHA
MVNLGRTCFEKTFKPLRKYLREGFRDSLRVFVSGGAGGNGLPKFGGIGGNGGNVIVEAKEGITLENVFKQNRTKRYVAQAGKNASHNFILGTPGENVVFEVPVGVSVLTDLRKKLGHLTGELNVEGEQLTVAKGGIGGHVKNGFLGSKGQSYSIKLDLKLIADIGLVGFPNAGKSTLLSAISEAKPKVASYPFTTVKPHLGIINYDDFRQISMADLPGLIEGAYANKGMGHQFLKHIERTKLLLMLVDINGFQLGPKYSFRSCLETVMLLTKELELYNEELLKKPSVLVINKMDTEGSVEKYKEIKPHLLNFKDFVSTYEENMRPNNVLKFADIIAISAKENEKDVKTLKNKLRILLDVMSEMQDSEQVDIYSATKESFREKGPTFV